MGEIQHLFLDTGSTSWNKAKGWVIKCEASLSLLILNKLQIEQSKLNSKNRRKLFYNFMFCQGRIYLIIDIVEADFLAHILFDCQFGRFLFWGGGGWQCCNFLLF